MAGKDTAANIADDPRAKLMYYLDCICNVVDLSHTENLSRLRDYKKYKVLTQREIDSLVSLTYLMSPEELDGKVLICDDDLCGDNNIAYFDLSAMKGNISVPENVTVDGQRRPVKKVMAYKRQWMMKYWKLPMLGYTMRLSRIAAGRPPQPQCCCTVL